MSLSIRQSAEISKFAQELLSTFETSLGEVSLIPSIGGVFTIDLVHADAQSEQPAKSQQAVNVQTTRIWDRKTEGGFPGMSFSCHASLPETPIKETSRRDML